MPTNEGPARAGGRRPAPDTAALQLVVGTPTPAPAPHGQPVDQAGSALAVHRHGSGVVYALSPVTALAGLRPAHEATHLLDLLGCPELTRVRVRMAAVPSDADPRLATIGALVTLLRWPRGSAADLVHNVAERVAAALPTRGVARDTDARRSFTLVSALARLFPHDAAVLAPLLLEPLSLATGDALLLPAGTPHAVLSGTALRFTPAGGATGIAGLRRHAGPLDLDDDRTAVLGTIEPLSATVEGPVPNAPGSITLVAVPAVASLCKDAETGLPRVVGVAGAWSLIASDLVPGHEGIPPQAAEDARRRWWSAGRTR